MGKARLCNGLIWLTLSRKPFTEAAPATNLFSRAVLFQRTWLSVSVWLNAIQGRSGRRMQGFAGTIQALYRRLLVIGCEQFEKRLRQFPPCAALTSELLYPVLCWFSAAPFRPPASCKRVRCCCEVGGPWRAIRSAAWHLSSVSPSCTACAAWHMTSARSSCPLLLLLLGDTQVCARPSSARRFLALQFIWAPWLRRQPTVGRGAGRGACLGRQETPGTMGHGLGSEG